MSSAPAALEARVKRADASGAACWWLLLAPALILAVAYVGAGAR